MPISYPVGPRRTSTTRWYQGQYPTANQHYLQHLSVGIPRHILHMNTLTCITQGRGARAHRRIEKSVVSLLCDTLGCSAHTPRCLCKPSARAQPGAMNSRQRSPCQTRVHLHHTPECSKKRDYEIGTMLEIRGRHAYTYNLVTNTFKNQGLWSIYGEAMDPYRIHIKKSGYATEMAQNYSQIQADY